MYPTINICICTYKRSEMLGRLLSALQSQKSGGLFGFVVIIVDNDVDESARQCVTKWQQKSQFPIRYCVEPEQNIARARNKAVECASGDYICFIDDDEFPENTWLLNLYKALCAYAADGALGPVVPFFETEPPKWVTKGRMFERPSFSTGHKLSWCYTRTGNVLLKQCVFNNHERFDPKFGSGGEDRDFFRRLIKKGRTFIWCNEARVFENIPAQRWRKSVLLKRALLRGKMAYQSTSCRPVSLAKSLLAIVVYLPLLPFLIIAGQRFFMFYLIKCFDHLGKLFAFLRLEVVKEKYITSTIQNTVN